MDRNELAALEDRIEAAGAHGYLATRPDRPPNANHPNTGATTRGAGFAGAARPEPGASSGPPGVRSTGANPRLRADQTSQSHEGARLASCASRPPIWSASIGPTQQGSVVSF